MELPILLLIFLGFLVLVFVLPVRGYEKAKRAEQGTRALSGQILQISLKVELLEKRLWGLESQKGSSGGASGSSPSNLRKLSHYPNKGMRSR